MPFALPKLFLVWPLLFVLTPTIDAQTATNVGIKDEPITFQSETVKLAGTILRPAIKGPRPGIVLLAGSGPGTRDHLRIFAERFAQIGFAALIFDKRGSGESGGSWTEESLDDLADDALAATSFLKSQPDIDNKRVGVWGISQAGWVVSRAAARAPDVFAFAIVVTGGGVKPFRVELEDYAAGLDHAGITGADNADAMALVDRYFAYLKTGNDRAGLEQAIEASREKPWAKVVDLGRVMPSESARAKWEWVPTYDPAADIQELSMPILVVLGGKDRPALSDAALQAWRDNLARSQDATIIELVSAGHGATVPGTHDTMHHGGAPSYVTGYLELVDAWLRAHAK